MSAALMVGALGYPTAPPGGPVSVSSSNSVVDASGPTDSAPQGARHRRLLHTRWWTLPDPPTTPPGGLSSMSSSTSMVDVAGPANNTPRGPAIDIFFILGGGRCRTHWQRPQGACHQCLLQPQWWTLPDPPIAPLKGPSSTSSSYSVVDATGPADSTPRGPAIYVFFNLSCGRCQTRRQRPRGPAIDVFFILSGGRYRALFFANLGLVRLSVRSE
jgi:hypothetical protein